MKRIKRWTRRTLTVMAGVALGWWAAGLLPGPTPTLAQEAGHAEPHEAAEAGERGEKDAGQKAAESLVPVESTHWYPGVLWAAGGLFVAAATVGLLALKVRGPEPADPAASHDDHAHDDQAHDAHGHGTAGGGGH